MPGLSGCLHHFHLSGSSRSHSTHTKPSRPDTKVIYETNSFLLHPMELVPFIVCSAVCMVCVFVCMRFTPCHQRDGQKRWSEKDFRSASVFGIAAAVTVVASALYFNNNTSRLTQSSWALMKCVYVCVCERVLCLGTKYNGLRVDESPVLHSLRCQTKTHSPTRTKRRRTTVTEQHRAIWNGICKTQKKCSRLIPNEFMCLLLSSRPLPCARHRFTHPTSMANDD